MADEAPKFEKITTRIWREEPHPDNPFQAEACYCSGYDVYGDLLGKASYIEYLFLLFQLERPTPVQTRLLEILAVAIANPGIRDHSVRAAMNAGVGGSTRASALMAAVAVGAGNLGGAREVYAAVEIWNQCGTDLAAWQARLEHPPVPERADIWPEFEHAPGFNPQSVTCATPVLQTLDKLLLSEELVVLPWLAKHRQNLELSAGDPLAMTGVVAATCVELGFAKEQAEMLYLLLRLPGAAVHALEQEKRGVARYPFFPDGIRLTNDPGPIKQ